MTADVVPGLNEAIQTSFKTNVMKDRRIASITKRIRDGTASLHDAHDYSWRLGVNLSKALKENLTAETLPDGRLYYNIAKRTVTPALEENYELTNDIAATIQKIVDTKEQIGLNAVKPDFPKERVQGLIDKMTADMLSLDEALVWLGEPIINNSEAFFDDFVDSNARFRTRAGLKAKIIRKAEPGACDWCRALAGEFNYESAPDNIYQRHEFCRCSVIYQSERITKGVWSKQYVLDEDRNKRVELAQQYEKEFTAKRDKQIQEYMQQTGYTRRTAQESTRGKSDEEIKKDIEKVKDRQARIQRAQEAHKYLLERKRRAQGKG